MEKRVLGKTGLSVSVLGFGGAEIGFEKVEVSQVRSLLNQALDDGLTLIDTAAAYLESERLIGETIASRRKEYTLVTKCGALDGFTRSDWTKEGILKTIQQSLKNLKTDHVDVLLLHSCDEKELQKGDAIAGIEAAKAKGYARYIGYSGDSAAALWAVKSGKIDVLETSVNIADQEAIELTLPLAAKNNIGVIVKRPIANAVWRYAKQPENDYHVEYWKRFQKLEFGFAKDSAQDPASVALRFTLSQPGVTCAIVGSTKPGRWRENAEFVKAGRLPAADSAHIQDRWKEVATPSWVGQM